MHTRREQQEAPAAATLPSERQHKASSSSGEAGGSRLSFVLRSPPGLTIAQAQAAPAHMTVIGQPTEGWTAAARKGGSGTGSVGDAHGGSKNEADAPPRE